MRRGVRRLAGLREPAAPATGALHVSGGRPCGVVARGGRRSPGAAGTAAALRRPPDGRDPGSRRRYPMPTSEAGAPRQPTVIDPAVHARRWKTLGVLSLSLVI